LRGTSLEVVHAWEDGAKRLAPYAARPPGCGEGRLDAGTRLAEAVRAVLGDPSAVAVTVEVAEGLAARVLLDHARDADLLVLGCATGTGRGVIGAVARACLQRAPCPVVVVSAERMAAPVPA